MTTSLVTDVAKNAELQNLKSQMEELQNDAFSAEDKEQSKLLLLRLKAEKLHLKNQIFMSKFKILLDCV
jgi:hypothetical protein